MYSNITEQCKEIINGSSRTFTASFIYDNISYTDIKSLKLSVPSSSNGNITIGATISKSVEIVLGKVDIPLDSTIEVMEAVKLDSGEFEDIPMGVFTVTKSITKDSLTTIEAIGPLSTETRQGYFSELQYPASTIQMLNEISNATGIEIETDNLEEIQVTIKPEGYTQREVIGYIAALHGMNAMESRTGSIVFKWYEDCEEDIFTDKMDSPELNNDLFIINKFECINKDSTIVRGNGFTGISISNPLVTEELADVIWNKISGYTFRPGTFLIKSGTPCVDPWDAFTYNNERVIAAELDYVHDGGLQNTYKSVGESRTTSASQGPITQQMERYYAELVLIKEAMIDTLTVNEADIRYLKTDSLESITMVVKEAAIEELSAEFVTIEHLNTLNARVLNLETTVLTANSAIIKNLQSGVADINTLMFGTAGGTSIQTEFSNSVIAALGDAQIKSAMIDDVSADKVKSGSLYTNLVHIYGDESNKLSIVDNTIAISDGARTRVQIGKDASNDYNMYVWDKSGNLMFDALGITEDGITRQIIRDEVVKDDANINAAKLDIDSLFTEINGSSNTIKSTKVYFDSEKQTLDVVFESMTTTIDGLQTTQSIQGTQITTIQGQISSKIWQQDINTAVDKVEGDITTLSTQYSSLNQTVTGLSSTVGSHTTQINSLGSRVIATESSYTQLSDKFSWVVKSGTSASDFTLTDRMAELTAEIISLNGNVKVNGAMIVDGSITADKIDVEDLFAQDITATGIITGVKLQSIKDGETYTYIRDGILENIGSTLITADGGVHQYKLNHFGGRTEYSFIDETAGDSVNISASGIGMFSRAGNNWLTIDNENPRFNLYGTTSTEVLLYIYGGAQIRNLTINEDIACAGKAEFYSNVNVYANMTASAVKTVSGADLDALNSKLGLRYVGGYSKETAITLTGFAYLFIYTHQSTSTMCGMYFYFPGTGLYLPIREASAITLNGVSGTTTISFSCSAGPLLQIYQIR